MAEIFISCAEADSGFVWQLASQLESRGWTVWWDKNFRADASIAAETERELENARTVLVLWTRTSIGSPGVLHDANRAYDANKLLQVKASNVQASDIPRTLQSLPILDAVDLVAIERALSDRKRAVSKSGASKGTPPIAGQETGKTRLDHRRYLAINALIIFAAFGIGLGGWPWVGSAIGGPLVALLALPKQREILKSYRGHPRTDIVFGLLFETSKAVVGALASAWGGYFLALFLKR